MAVAPTATTGSVQRERGLPKGRSRDEQRPALPPRLEGLADEVILVELDPREDVEQRGLPHPLGEGHELGGLARLYVDDSGGGDGEVLRLDLAAMYHVQVVGAEAEAGLGAVEVDELDGGCGGGGEVGESRGACGGTSAALRFCGSTVACLLGDLF